MYVWMSYSWRLTPLLLRHRLSYISRAVRSNVSLQRSLAQPPKVRDQPPRPPLSRAPESQILGVTRTGSVCVCVWVRQTATLDNKNCENLYLKLPAYLNITLLEPDMLIFNLQRAVEIWWGEWLDYSYLQRQLWQLYNTNWTISTFRRIQTELIL